LVFGFSSGHAFSSGSVTTATISSLLTSGSHVISVDDVYGGTYRFFTKVLKPVHGVDVDFVNLYDPKNLKAAIKPNTKVISD
jgi:cystathionine gamma-lyase